MSIDKKQKILQNFKFRYFYAILLIASSCLNIEELGHSLLFTCGEKF
jgi:hypothetical protein